MEWLFKCLLFLGELAAQATCQSYGSNESARNLKITEVMCNADDTSH